MTWIVVTWIVVAFLLGAGGLLWTLAMRRWTPPPHVTVELLRMWVDGTGQCLYNVHPPEVCEGQGCPIHHPSDHLMAGFPTHYRYDRGLMERICPHGVGHPDPDHLAFFERKFGKEAAYWESVHGCCHEGCCVDG